jgi:hypothetical protein
MLTSPSIDDLLEGVIVALQAEVMPAVSNEKAMATVAMMQAVLQQVRATLPKFDAFIVDEHNSMTKTLRDTAAVLGTASGPEAERIRGRARALGSRADIPAPPDMTAAAAAHKALGDALVATMVDLDVLQRAGNEAADRALQVVRAHWGPRYARDVQTMLVGAGMIGRG